MDTGEDIIYFNSAAEFRKWLKKNHSTETELFVGFYKKDSANSKRLQVVTLKKE